MDDNAKLLACVQYLRRVYYVGADAWNLAALKALATTAFAEASKTVTIIGTNSEIGGASAQVTFDKMLLLSAIEQLLAEVDPAAPPPGAPSGAYMDFSGRAVQN